MSNTSAATLRRASIGVSDDAAGSSVDTRRDDTRDAPACNAECQQSSVSVPGSGVLRLMRPGSLPPMREDV
jgi:hypothetical protein